MAVVKHRPKTIKSLNLPPICPFKQPVNRRDSFGKLKNDKTIPTQNCTTAGSNHRGIKEPIPPQHGTTRNNTGMGSKRSSKLPSSAASSSTHSQSQAKEVGFTKVDKEEKKTKEREIEGRRKSASISSQEDYVVNSRLSQAASYEKVILSRNKLMDLYERSKPNWFHFKTLAEGDFIGIETIDLGDGVEQRPPRIAVVSEGSTVILMDKKFFINNASDYLRMDLRANGPRFPNENMVKRELERKSLWNKFQTDFLAGMYKRKMKEHYSWKYP